MNGPSLKVALGVFLVAGQACVVAQTATEPPKTTETQDAPKPGVGPAAGPVVRPAEPPKVAPTREAPAVMPPTTDKGTPVPSAKPSGVIPGLVAEDRSLPARRFYPEGTFLSKRIGRLVKASTGDVVFVPSRDSKGRGEAPMVVLPTQTLSRLEAAPGVFTETSSVVLSGEVYVYFDRQYVLPTAYSIERQAAEPATPAPKTNPPTPAVSPTTATPANGSAPASKASTAADPAVAELIQDLETKRGSAKAPEITATQAAATQTGPAESSSRKPTETGQEKAKAGGSLTAEGSVLFNKRARLTRVATGPLMVSFDGDSTSAAPEAMVLLRCRMAQKLDELAASRGDDLVVQVSGRVFVYGGRNYLLPTLAQVLPKGDVKTLQ
jgi:hypothetical protein